MTKKLTPKQKARVDAALAAYRVAVARAVTTYRASGDPNNDRKVAAANDRADRAAHVFLALGGDDEDM